MTTLNDISTFIHEIEVDMNKMETKLKLEQTKTH